jgi:hypothetical protein
LRLSPISSLEALATWLERNIDPLRLPQLSYHLMSYFSTILAQSEQKTPALLLRRRAGARKTLADKEEVL